MSRYAIIGGAGVFALHFSKYLLEQEDTELVLSIGRNAPKSKAFTLGIGDNDDRYIYEQVHLVYEQDRLFELFDKYKPDYVINFAALAYATSWEKSFRYYDTNVTAVSRMCEELSKRDFFKRFIQIGTSELYGSVENPAKEDSPIKPTSPYAVSKLAADMHLETMWKVMQFPMNIIRPSNAYAPGQLMYRILPRAVYAGLAGEQLPLEGGGEVKKSFMHARDLARAIKLVIDRGELGEIYNVGPESPSTIRFLVEKVAEELGVPFEKLVKIMPGRVGEDAQYWLDSTKIKKLGYEESVDLSAGVRDMVEWGKKHFELLHDEPKHFVLRA